MKKNIGICLDHKSFERIKKVKEIGFDFVEAKFSDFAKEPQSVINEYADLLKELNLPCVSMNCLIVGDFVMTGDNADHGKIAEHLESTLEKIQILGTKNFVLGSGKARSVPEGYSREKALEQIYSLVVDTISPIMAKYNATLSIEELRKEECNVFVTCKEVMQFIKGVNLPNVKLLVDYYHAMLGGDTHEEIASYGGYISHVHIASPKNNRFIPQPNDGEDYAGFFKALDNASYTQGNISLEGSTGGDNFYETITASLNYLKTF